MGFPYKNELIFKCDKEARNFKGDIQGFFLRFLLSKKTKDKILVGMRRKRKVI